MSDTTGDATRSRQNTETLADDDVYEYLKQHPDFLQRHADLLDDVDLAHAPDGVISLAQRQTQTLKQRNAELRARLSELIDSAHRNDQLFKQMRELVLGLIATESPFELAEILANQLRRNFDIPKCRILLFQEHRLFHEHNVFHKQKAKAVESDSEKNGDTYFINVFDSQRMSSVLHLQEMDVPLCGPLRTEQCTQLFEEEDIHLASVAITPLNPRRTQDADQAIGLLVLGSEDASQFCSSMDTLFLEYLSEVLATLLT